MAFGVPDQLLSTTNQGDLIDEKDLWTLNESYLELNHPFFTIHPEHTLNEIPEQYKVKGPGQITLGELAQDDPAVEHTSADDFRKDPTQFSWLKMDQPENITNPLEGESTSRWTVSCSARNLHDHDLGRTLPQDAGS